MPDRLRPAYDFPLGNLAADPGTRGRIYRAIAPGSRVLDVGCDTGRFGDALRTHKGCVVHGIERDSQAAQIAATRLERVLTRTIEGEDSFDGLETYDVVLFLDVLEHLYDPWSTARGALRALRAGGMIYGVVPNIAHVSVVRRLLRGEFEYADHGTMDRTHIRWFTRNSFRHMMERAGFERVTVEISPAVPWLPDIPYVGEVVGNSLARLFPDQLGGSLLGYGYKSA